MLWVNTWLRWSSPSHRIKFFLSLPPSLSWDKQLKWHRSIWPLALVRSLENSDSLNNIPPYIRVVSERVTNPNWFPLIKISQTPVIFQVQENYPTSFNQEVIQAPPSSSDLLISIPLTTFGSHKSIRSALP